MAESADSPATTVNERLADSRDVPIGGDAPAPSGGAVLSLPGLQSAVSDQESLPAPAVSTVELPTLTTANVTLEAIQQVVEVAKEFPDEPGIGEYVFKAYLLLAIRQFGERRFRDTLASVAQADKWGASRRDVARISARTYLELQDMERAFQWAQAALAFGADADMYSVLGNVYYLREELVKAIEAWEQSLALKEDGTVRAALERARREADVEGEYDKERLAHFIVKYEGETMEQTGRLVLGSLEKSHGFLKSRLDFEPKEPIVVILYARRDYNELGGPDWSAGLFDGKVRVPARGLVSLDQNIESTLRHELTHAFLYAQAGQGAPRWLQEGMAEYCEGTDASQFGEMLAERIEQDENFAYCLVGSRCDVRLFYPAATSVVDYLIQNRGMGGIKDLLTLLGQGHDIDSALDNVMGRDELGLMNDWQHFMRRRYL
ncbi:MAG: peptidase MA family metallohydrolase [Vicinamibacteria bacterium]